MNSLKDSYRILVLMDRDLCNLSEPISDWGWTAPAAPITTVKLHPQVLFHFLLLLFPCFSSLSAILLQLFHHHPNIRLDLESSDHFCFLIQHFLLKKSNFTLITCVGVNQISFCTSQFQKSESQTKINAQVCLVRLIHFLTVVVKL